MELPPVEMPSPPGALHPGPGAGWAQGLQAPLPSGVHTDDEPPWSAWIGERSGLPGTSRRLRQAFCPSVWPMAMRHGAVQKGRDRVSESPWPHEATMAALAGQGPVGDIDEAPGDGPTPWPRHWTMATDPVTPYGMHPPRCQAGFVEGLGDGQGLVVGDSDGV